jgi:hypothetical protein
VALALCAALALAIAGLALLAAAWDTPLRMAVVAVLASGCAAAVFTAWRSFRGVAARRGRLLRRSLAQWRRDVTEIRPPSESDT